MKGHIYILIFIFLGLGLATHAQTPAKPSEEVKQSGDILNNLDTLMTLWYVKNAAPAKVRNSQNIRGYKPDEVPTFSDSVYARRIRMIPSPLPLAYNQEVKGFIDLYANRKREQVEKMLGLSEIYFPIFEEALDRHKMPLELKYLSVVESALNTRAESRVHATGLWQFMYTTARLYNLDINSFVDQRKDPVLATEAAVLMLRDLHNIFGDWFLAIAAYNCGPGNVNKAIRRSGGKRTFWEIYSYLPAETRGYVPAFIAATYVFHYHQEHNLYPQEVTLPKFVDTVIISRELSFAPIAKVLDMNIDEIRDLNPQYTHDLIPAVGTTYTLRLPAAKAGAFITFKDSIYHTFKAMMLAANPNRNPDDSSGIAKIMFRGGRGGEASGPKERVKYTVKAGDNLGFIADLFDVSVYSLKRWNHIRSHKVPVGRRLVINVPAEKSRYYRKINTMTMLQKKKELYGHRNPVQNSEGQNQLAKKEEEKQAQDQNQEQTADESGDDAADSTATAAADDKKAVAEQPAKPGKKVKVKKQLADTGVAKAKGRDKTAVREEKKHIQYYTVQKGDTLWSIAQRFPGETVDEIKRENGITNNHKIQPGQRIKVHKS